MTPIRDTDYLAVSARLHAMETRLLTSEKRERLLEAASEARSPQAAGRVRLCRERSAGRGAAPAEGKPV